MFAESARQRRAASSTICLEHVVEVEAPSRAMDASVRPSAASRGVVAAAERSTTVDAAQTVCQDLRAVGR